MLFYKVTAILADEEWAEQNSDRRTRIERARRIVRIGEEYNEKCKAGSYVFVSDFGSNDAVCGVIMPDAENPVKLFLSFADSIGLYVKDPFAAETTFSSIKNLLSTAECNGYIENDNDVLERMGLDRLGGRGVDFGENLLNETGDKEALYKVSRDLLTEESLRPELDRVFSGKSSSRAFGHPVHYMIKTDDRETRKKLSRTLLQALYDVGRLKSRRYCFIDFRPGHDFSSVSYDALYKSLEGGALIVRYNAGDDLEEESGYADSGIETVSSLCETMIKYRNRVLTVFCLPRASEKVKKLFYENLGAVGVVEIEEDLADCEKSSGYLRMLCRESRIRPAISPTSSAPSSKSGITTK